MMKVKIQTDHKYRFTIPVPYSFLGIFGSLLSSKFLWRQANKWINYHLENPLFSTFPTDRKVVKHSLNSLIKELQYHKGLVIVDIQLEDGTKVRVQL
jgi:hypothetical protein